MPSLELVCLAIVALYVGARLRGAPSAAERRAFVARFAALAIAGFVGEDSVIDAYGFYGYAATWSVRLDRVPLVVVLVWPVVVDSAAVVARAVCRRSGEGDAPALRVAAVTAAIVLADASLIEPVAVRAGLWRWVEPGIFGVPLVGIAGWAHFAGAATFALERLRGARAWLVVVIAPLATHALIVASWWALFRWIRGSLPELGAVACAWAGSVIVAVLAARAAVRPRPLDLMLRAPGAAFFFGLLLASLSEPWSFAAPDGAAYVPPGLAAAPLALYAVAFAPPYLAALVFKSRRIRENSPSVRSLARPL